MALVGDPITFTSTNPCTTACSLTWRRPDIGLARFGGVIVGRGEQFTMSFTDPGSYQVVLDLGEQCDGTTRLICHSYTLVFVDVVTELPPVDPTPPADPVTPPPDAVTPPPADVTPPPADVTPPPADVTPPPADVTPPPADVTPPPADVTPPPADVTPPPADVTPPPADVTPPPTDPVVTPPVDPVVTPPVDPVVEAPTLVAPNDLTATIVGRRNRLTWTNPVSSATSLVLERCRGVGCTSWEQVSALDLLTTSFIESRPRRGGTDIFSYRLAVSDATGTVYSNVEVAVASPLTGADGCAGNLAH